MKIKQIYTAVLVSVASLVILAITGMGNAYADVVPSFDEQGITLGNSPNFENTVKLKVKKRGEKGFKVIVKGKGGGDYLNSSPPDSFKIKNGKYKLVALFDPEGNFIKGSLKIKGKLDTPFGKARGTLMKASLGSGLTGEPDFAYISDQGLVNTSNQGISDFVGSLLGFNTHDIVCKPVIDKLVGGCATNDFVYLTLEESGFSPTVKNFKSMGLSVAKVPTNE